MSWGNLARITNEYAGLAVCMAAGLTSGQFYMDLTVFVGLWPLKGSGHVHPTIDIQGLAGDIATRWRGQETDGRGNILRCSQAR